MKPRLSTEPAGNVIFCAFIAGVGKYLMGGIKLDHAAIQKEAGLLCDAGSLLHIMRDNDDRVLRLQLEDEVFDLRG
jgi:hypothetical protein